MKRARTSSATNAAIAEDVDRVASFYPQDAVVFPPDEPIAVGKINSGVLVLNRALRLPDVHRRMIEIARSGTSYDEGDQGVLHQLLEESPQIRVGELDPAYNVMVVWKKFGRWEQIRDRVRILHFVNGFKPWSPHHAHDLLFDADLERHWDDAFRGAIVPTRSGAPADAEPGRNAPGD